MSIAFQYYPIENFPVDSILGAEWDTNTQFCLPTETVGDDAHSVIKFVGISPYLDYFKYHVRHESLRDCWIRIDRDDRRKAIFVDEFDIFIPPNKSYLLIKTKIKQASELVRRIKIKYPGFCYLLREINLEALKDDLKPNIRGGWFRDLEIEDVSAAAIFGDSVSESDEWDNYSSNGTLSSLVMEFSHRGAKHSVNISTSGAITLYSNYEEAYALELVEKFNNIAMKYQTEFEPKRQRDSKKTK